MNNLYSGKEEENGNKNKMLHRTRSENAIGLDMDEQEMNGLYGMPETDVEDSRHEKK